MPGARHNKSELLLSFTHLLIFATKQYEYSDRELVEQIRENPYYQFFIGLLGYQDKEPFVPSILVEFRKHLTDDMLGDINEMIIAYNTPDDVRTGYGKTQADESR